MAGERTRPFIGHHRRQARHEVDADVAGGELAVQALARQAALVRHRVHVGGGPIGFHRSLQPPAVEVFGAPFAHVRIDELRPQADEIGCGAGAGVDGELERRALAVRRGLGLDRHVDGRPSRRQAIDEKLRRRFEEAGVEHHGLEADRVGAGPFRAELGAVRLEMRAPHPRRIGRRGDPALRLDMRQSGENLNPVDAKPPRGFVPGHGAARFVDKKRRRVGVVDSHPSGADGEPAGEIPERRIGRKLCVELERDRALGGQGRRLPVERLEVGEAEVTPLDRKGRRIAVRRLRHDFPRSRRAGRRDRGVRPRARMVECDGEIIVDDGAVRRLVFDFEMAAGERQPVERLGGAGHAFGRGADEGGKPGDVSVRGRGARQRDRGRA